MDPPLQYNTIVILSKAPLQCSEVRIEVGQSLEFSSSKV